MTTDQHKRVAKLASAKSVVPAVAVGVFVAHLGVAASHGGPVAVPDVAAYLNIAQWINGAKLPPQLPFFPAYGVLLSPFGSLSGSSLHTVALAVNGLFAGCSVLCVGRIARTLRFRQEHLLILCLLAALHPSLSGASRIAWPETLLTLMILTIGVCLTENHYWGWYLAGLLGGLSLALHPRAVVLVVALIVVSMSARQSCKCVAGLMLGTAISLSLVIISGTWPTTRVEALGEFVGISPVLASISGQTLALGAGTLGVGLLGVIAGLWAMRRTSTTNYVFSFFSISAIGMLILGGWTLAGSDRPDTLLYGRYIDPWSLPLLIAGVASISSLKVRRGPRAIASLLTVAAVGVIGTNASLVDGSPRRIMTMSLGAIWDIADNRLFVVVVIAAGIATTGVIMLYQRPVMVLTACLLLALASTISGHVHLRNVGQISEGQMTLAAHVPTSVACLSHDVSAKSYALWLYRLQLPHMEHHRISLIEGDEPCGDFVIATSEAMVHCEQTQLIGIEPNAEWGLWRYSVAGCD